MDGCVGVGWEVDEWDFQKVCPQRRLPLSLSGVWSTGEWFLRKAPKAQAPVCLSGQIMTWSWAAYEGGPH